MSFRVGKISVAEGVALIGMLLIPEIYLTEPSLMIGFTGSSAWIVKIFSNILLLGVLLTILMMYKSYCQTNNAGQMAAFPAFLKDLLGNKLAILLLVLWAVLFELETILTLREFVDQTMITALKTSNMKVVLFFFALSILAIAYSGLEVVLRAAYLFLWVGVAAVLLIFVLLIPSYEPMQLLPWRGYGLSQVAKYSLLDMGIGAKAAAILFIAPHFQNIRTLKKGILYGIGYSTAVKVIVFFMAVMIFGSVTSPERGLLYYELARYVNVSQYVQRIDAVFIMVWLSAGLISTVLTQYFSVIFCSEAFGLKDTKVLLKIGVLLTAAMAMMPDTIAETIQWRGYLSYYVTTAFLLVNFILLGVGYYVKCRGNQSCVGQSKS